MSERMASANDYKEVAQVAAKYIEAIRTGNIDMLDDMFHKNAVAYGTVDGALVGGAGNPAVAFIKANGKSPEIVFHIDVLDITPTTAAVRIVMEKDAVGSDCNANLLLLKLNDRWTVIAKVFHQFG